MSTATFYHPDFGLTDTDLELSNNEALHALKSRRLKAGQAINVINGKGLIAECVICQIDRQRLRVHVSLIKQVAANKNSLTIATAIPKGDRQRTMVDMLTQLGVKQIIPLHCDYSTNSSKAKFIEKWQRTSIEACKQSQRCWLPKISEKMTVLQLLNKYTNESNVQLTFADSEGVGMTNLNQKCDHLVIIIGPEGGFSETEIDLFKQFQLASLKLTDAILRTEAAAVSSAAQYFSCKR